MVLHCEPLGQRLFAIRQHQLAPRGPQNVLSFFSSWRKSRVMMGGVLWGIPGYLYSRRIGCRLFFEKNASIADFTRILSQTVAHWYIYRLLFFSISFPCRFREHDHHDEQLE